MSLATTDPGQVAMGGGTVPFTITHGQAEPRSVLADESVLGVFCYGTQHSALDDPRLLCVPLESIGPVGQVDILHSATPVEHGYQDGFSFAHNGQVLLAQLRVEPTASHDVEVQSYDAYQRINALLEGLGYPHPLRLWNYIDHINQGEGDNEVYKRFCLGRARAIHSVLEREDALPAASAIGSHDNGGALVVHLLAARAPGIQVENPRQVSAFHYPRQYGIRSPSFSRARVMHWPGASHLYLSGTASVVGHETLHAGDCEAQIQESLRNIDTVLESASTTAGDEAHFSHAQLKLLRVYVRNRADLSTVKTSIEAHLGNSVPVVYLRGDICRQDLLVEVDGMYSHPA